ncbi:hypothetical protein ACFYY1_37215 [Streptomyces sp. NPDC001890]|uniref:hypothetical protein n=1 Tax=Streptomyces sp. NPDC001890 TaxID=3364620 RepID=UPI0036A309DA
MAEPQAAGGRRRSSDRSARYREREADGRRNNRLKVSYTDTELAIVREAAARDNQALASWVAAAALAVAAEVVVPVSPNAKDVLAELVRATTQLARVGNNHNQIAKIRNAEGRVSSEHEDAVNVALVKAIGQLHAATLQVMRERQPRS